MFAAFLLLKIISLPSKYHDMKKSYLIALTIFICSPILSQQIISAGSSVDFEISNFGLMSVEGTVSNMNGTADFNEDNLELCSFDVCVDASTIDTGNEERDEHLNKDDFFDTANHPNICFYSDKVIKTSNGYAATGTLTIKGIEKIKTINFSYQDKTFTGELTVARAEYGIGPNGGFMVGKEVDVRIVGRVE